MLVKWVTKTDLEFYSKYVTVDKKGDKVLLVECMNAIYGTMVAEVCCINASLLTAWTRRNSPRIYMTFVYGTRSSKESSIQSVPTLTTARSPMSS